MGGSAESISPLSPVDLIIDHSIMVDKFASNDTNPQDIGATCSKQTTESV
jgi:aconitase A